MDLMKLLSMGEDQSGAGDGSYSKYSSSGSYDPQSQLENLRAINQRADRRQEEESLNRLRNSYLGARSSGDDGRAESISAALQMLTNSANQNRTMDITEEDNQNRTALGDRELDLKRMLGLAGVDVTKRGQDQQFETSKMQNDTTRSGQDQRFQLGTDENRIREVLGNKDYDLKKMLGMLSNDTANKEITSREAIAKMGDKTNNRQIDSNNANMDKQRKLESMKLLLSSIGLSPQDVEATMKQLEDDAGVDTGSWWNPFD